MADPSDSRTADVAGELEYLARRARQERERAEQALDVGVALAHRRLAEAYEQRLADLAET
ncbi:MAG TPA: hypothetical protein VN029_04400 [Sphingomonas sp.]|nr:hypothetical protein [Sphingomonas sp.]